MKVYINNNPYELPEGATVADALSAAKIEPIGIATAVNQQVIAADKRHTTALADGDKIIIIKAFCGG